MLAALQVAAAIQSVRSRPDLPHVVPERGLHISGPVKTAVHQPLKTLLRPRASHGIEKGAPFGAISESSGRLATLTRRFVSAIACLSNDAMRFASFSTRLVPTAGYSQDQRCLEAEYQMSLSNKHLNAEPNEFAVIACLAHVFSS